MGHSGPFDSEQWALRAEYYPMQIQHNVQQKVPCGPVSLKKPYGVLIADAQLGSTVYVTSQAYDIDSDNAPRITVTFSTSGTYQCLVAILYHK